MLGVSRLFLLAFVLSAAQAAPFHSKRIAQVISDSTRKWQTACLAAGGGGQCNPLSVTSFTTLLAAAGPCDQQNAADQMIDLAKQLNNDAQMISLAQIFCQQPRNSPSSESVQYCQQAPRNSELSGLFQCQFAGVNPQTFVGGVPVGSPGTIPFGKSSPLNPSGSCPANPGGPIPDGQQLVDITQNPGSGGNVNPPPASGGTPNEPPKTSSSVVNSPSPMPTPSQTPSNPPSQGGDFRLQNGMDAQKLNAQFTMLTPDSSCTDGQDACVSGGFAQCVNGKFAITQCSSPLICAALPLVNKPGTSITCTTKQDAITRITNTGAQGGLTGSG